MIISDDFVIKCDFCGREYEISPDTLDVDYAYRKRRHFGSTSAGPSGTGKAGKWYRSDGQLVPAPRKTHERRFRADRLSITVIAVPLLLDEAALTPLQYLGLSWNHPEFEIHKLLHISGS